MHTLVYLCYGTGHHINETRFSIDSAFRHDREVPVMLYTDDPAPFEGLPIRIVPIDRPQLDEWAGTVQFRHRRKLCVLQDALRRLNTPCALMDSDTYFIKSPRRLFARIGPGRAVMHMREGLLANWNAAALAAYLAAPLSAGRELGLPGPETPMWNSGVIGLDPQELPLCERMLKWVDHLYPNAPGIWVEQFVAGALLAEHSQLRECWDVVRHYWLRELRLPFGELLHDVMGPAGVDQTTLQRVYKNLPAEPFEWRFKRRVRRFAEATGLYTERVRPGAEPRMRPAESASAASEGNGLGRPLLPGELAQPQSLQRRAG